MTRKHTPRPQTELDRLYSESGAAEPAAGLDRIILARADRALEDARRTPRRPLLAGLATASVAVVALAVVLQQTPTAPESVQQLERTEISTASQKERDIDADLSEPSALREPPSEARRAPVAPPSRGLGDTFESAVPDNAPAAPMPTPEASAAGSSLESITVTGSRIGSDPRASEDAQHSPHALLFEQLRALISNGQLDQARQLLAQTEACDGGLQLPVDLETALRLEQP